MNKTNETKSGGAESTPLAMIAISGGSRRITKQFLPEHWINQIISTEDGWLRCARGIADAMERGQSGEAEEGWTALIGARNRNTAALTARICNTLSGRDARVAKNLLRTLAKCEQFKEIGTMLLHAKSSRELKEFFAELGKLHLNSPEITSKVREAVEKASPEGPVAEYRDTALSSSRQLVEFAKEMHEAWKRLDVDGLVQRWAALSCAYKENPGKLIFNFEEAIGFSHISRMRMQRLTRIAGWEEFKAGTDFYSKLPHHVTDVLELPAVNGD